MLFVCYPCFPSSSLRSQAGYSLSLATTQDRPALSLRTVSSLPRVHMSSAIIGPLFSPVSA